MKILVLQLARLGDIYQSWPCLRALRRQHPQAQVDVMVRPRFDQALEGLEAISGRVHLPTTDILSPVFRSEPDLKEAIHRLGAFLKNLRAQGYDQVINLSFSPLSSYLVHSLQTKDCKVAGYTRHRDGFFDIQGEVSAYFYAQVGPGRSNRFHLTELMAGVAGVTLRKDDWHPPTLPASSQELPPRYVVIHVGASEAKKSLPPFKWSRIIRYFSESAKLPIVLIGAPNERVISEGIVSNPGPSEIINLVGQTELPELFSVLRRASLLVGCDSAPMHMASLTQTPCLNISLGAVNFWETGPRSSRSYVLLAPTPEEVVSEYVGIIMTEILSGQEPRGLAKYSEGNPCYEVSESDAERFCWDLNMAVYLGQTFPMTDDLRFFEGCTKLNSINDLVIEQLEQVQKVGLEKMKPILDRADEVVHTIGDLVPELKIYTRWLKAERARVRPGPLKDIVEATWAMHLSLKQMLRPYVIETDNVKEEGIHG